MLEKKTHQRIPAPQIATRERLPILVHQLKLAADLGPAHALGSLGHALALHALLLVLEVPDEAGAREHEQQPGLPRERAGTVPALGLLHRLGLVPALLEDVLFRLRGGGWGEGGASLRGGRPPRGVRRRVRGEEPLALLLLGARSGLQERS